MDLSLFAITKVEGRPDERSVWTTDCDHMTRLIRIHKWDTSLPYSHGRSWEYRCSLATSHEVRAALGASGFMEGVVWAPNNVIIPVAPSAAIGDAEANV